MTRVDRSMLVEAFAARFAETRSIPDAVDAVARAMELRFEAAEESRERVARAEQQKVDDERFERREAYRHGPHGSERQWSEEARVTSPEIIEAVADSHGFSVKSLLSRQRRYAGACQESMWLHRTVGEIGYREIGRLHNGRDHSTAVVACQKIERLIKADPDYRRRLLALVERVDVAADVRRAA